MGVGIDNRIAIRDVNSKCGRTGGLQGTCLNNVAKGLLKKSGEMARKMGWAWKQENQRGQLMASRPAKMDSQLPRPGM